MFLISEKAEIKSDVYVVGCFFMKIQIIGRLNGNVLSLAIILTLTCFTFNFQVKRSKLSKSQGGKESLSGSEVLKKHNSDYTNIKITIKEKN